MFSFTKRKKCAIMAVSPDRYLKNTVLERAKR